MENLFCCGDMRENILLKCDEHQDILCSDKLIYYDEIFDEYGLIIHDGGESYVLINFCPWCGVKLPESKRDEWFSELEKIGYDNPFEQEIPEDFKSGEWHK